MPIGILAGTLAGLSSEIHGKKLRIIREELRSRGQEARETRNRDVAIGVVIGVLTMDMAFGPVEHVVAKIEKKVGDRKSGEKKTGVEMEDLGRLGVRQTAHGRMDIDVEVEPGLGEEQPASEEPAHESVTSVAAEAIQNPPSSEVSAGKRKMVETTEQEQHTASLPTSSQPDQEHPQPNQPRAILETSRIESMTFRSEAPNLSNAGNGVQYDKMKNQSAASITINIKLESKARTVYF